nr:hypothetical protein [Tanacetum cinerariifolium]
MMMQTKMKNPPLDQTEGPKDEEKERSQSQQVLQSRKLPGRLETQGSKSQQTFSSESAMQTTLDLEEPSHLEFETSIADDQPIAETSQHPECSEVKVSTLSRLIRKAEKSTGPKKSCSNHDLELEVSFVEKTIQDAEKFLQ